MCSVKLGAGFITSPKNMAACIFFNHVHVEGKSFYPFTSGEFRLIFEMEM